MNTKQENKLAMYLAVKAALDSNNATWQSLQAFADGYTDFTSHITRIQTLELSQVTDSSGIAVDKKASKTAMATAAQKISAAVHAYAVKTKNNTLATETNFSVSDLTGERDADAIKDCQNIHDVANTNLVSLAAYGVTAAKMTALQANIDGFKAIVSKPRDNIVAGATVTQQLSDEFDAADETLSEILDGLVVQFNDANPKFVSDYNNARIIVDRSASHVSPNPPTPAGDANGYHKTGVTDGIDNQAVSHAGQIKIKSKKRDSLQQWRLSFVEAA